MATSHRPQPRSHPIPSRFPYFVSSGVVSPEMVVPIRAETDTPGGPSNMPRPVTNSSSCPARRRLRPCRHSGPHRTGGQLPDGSLAAWCAASPACASDKAWSAIRRAVGASRTLATVRPRRPLPSWHRPIARDRARVARHGGGASSPVCSTTFAPRRAGRHHRWWPNLDFDQKVELLETVDVEARLRKQSTGPRRAGRSQRDRIDSTRCQRRIRENNASSSCAANSKPSQGSARVATTPSTTTARAWPNSMVRFVRSAILKESIASSASANSR